MSVFPLVSIVMPSYNSARFLEKSILSVIQQTYRNWELFIIDDASTDHSLAVAERFRRKDSRIKIFQLASNQGTGIARNYGIRAASGEYIAFLDADDLWLPHKLETQLRFMAENRQKLSFSSYELIDENDLPLHLKVEALEHVSPEKMLKANYIGNLTGMYHAKSLGKIYCSSLRKRQDWYLWIQAVKSSGGAMGISESLAFYRIRRNSISRNKFRMLPHNYNVYRQSLGFSVPKSCFYFAIFLFEQTCVKSRQKANLPSPKA